MSFGVRSLLFISYLVHFILLVALVSILSKMNLILLLILVFLVAVCYAVSHILEARHDAREPPTLPSSIPVVGHVIGMLRKKARYYVQLR